MRLPALPLALALAGFAGPLHAAHAAEPRVRPDVRWAIAQRDLDFGAWRGRIAGARRTEEGELWIGGAPASESSAGSLYRFDGGEWRLAHTLGIAGARTFVLAVDPRERLWVAPYPQDAAKIYGHLEVRRLERGVWHRQVLTPGLWPQAMAWPRSEEGWIAGNNGLFYHYLRGTWRLETLDLPAAQRRNRNVLALLVPAPDEGWAAGTKGLIARYDGERWRPLAVPPSLANESLEALDQTLDGTLWIAGSQGTLAARDLQGGWRVWKAPGDAELLGIDMLDGRDGWAVGAAGTILRFDGRTWHRQPSPTRAVLSDVRMSAGNQGWIAGSTLVLRAVSGPAPRFWDRSSELTALSGRGAEEVAAVDADGDGDLDLFTVDLDAIRRFDNGGGGTLAERGGLTAGPRREIASGGVAFGDADGDGGLDMVVAARRPKSLWLDRLPSWLGAGGPRLLPFYPPGTLRDLPSLVDLDGDGRLDLHLSWSSAGSAPSPRDGLLRGDGAGGWRRRPATTGARGGEPLVLWGDLDGDLDLDLLEAPAGGGIEMWRNEGGQLHQATSGSGLDRGFDPDAIGQGVAWDLDRDGDLDLLLLGSRLHAFSNDGHGRFAEAPDWIEPLATNPALVQLQVAAGDLDLDGWPEILLAPVEGSRAHVALLSRGADGRYRDVAVAAGVRDLAGNAAAFADLDGDGDLDLVVAGAQRTYLLANLASQEEGGRFLKVRVRGAGGDPLARGAQVRVYEAGRLGEAGALRGFQCVGVGLPNTGVSHLSELVFGVPAGGRFDLEARYLDGRRAVLRNVRAGTVATLYERPIGARQVAIAGARLRRAALRADPLSASLQLGAAVLLCLGLRSVRLRRLGSGPLARHPATVFALLALQLSAAVLLVDAPPWGSRIGPPALAFAGVLLLLGFDRAWSAWRRARGATHLGPYRLEALIGEGGMGAVWQARHLVSRREVALKVLQPHRTAEEAHRTRFLREGATMARLDHPNIVRVHETGEIGGRGFISMERLSGCTLGALLRRHGPLGPAGAAAFLAVAAEALSEVHRAGIVHRDVKSENFYVTGDGSEPPGTPGQWRARLKLMDFGVAHVRELATLTLGDGLLGTLAYLAPEQAKGSVHDPRSDLYALGVVAFEIALGHLPLSPLLERSAAGTVAEAAQERELAALPLPLARLVSRLLARAPSLRPAHADEVAEAAELCVDEGRGQPGPQRPATAADLAPEEIPTSTERLWLARLAEVRRVFGLGRVAEAQVQVLALIAELRLRLESLAPEERSRYARRHLLGDVLELERQTRLGLQEEA